MTPNLSKMILHQGAARPQLTLGTPERKITLEKAIDQAAAVARVLVELDLAAKDRIAVVASTSTEYLVYWLACQFAGLSPALINPSYPIELIRVMVADLNPSVVASSDGDHSYGYDAITIGFADLLEGRLRVSSRDVHLGPADASRLPGFTSDCLDCAGFMHTSGTTGHPKFCAQSHLYFLRLGRFVGRFMGLSPDDHVFAPLPMFHINPFGYGFVSALYAGADLTALGRFRPEEFWALAKAESSTALILHAPPVQVLKQRASTSDAMGHRVRIMFYADRDFIEKFRIPIAVSGYGSTEVGGLTHHRIWKRGEYASLSAPEGIGHLGGRPRPDIDWSISEDGEILIRGLEPGVLFSGYWRDGKLDPSLDDDGWFRTGDLGRREGNELVFIERQSESIRVRGEYIPIDFIEQQIAGELHGLDIALWKREGGQAADEIPILYVSGDHLYATEIKILVAMLPKFMRPVELIRIAKIPRDEGTGKLRRRLLKDAKVLESCPL